MFSRVQRGRDELLALSVAHILGLVRHHKLFNEVVKRKIVRDMVVKPPWEQKSKRCDCQNLGEGSQSGKSARNDSSGRILAVVCCQAVKKRVSLGISHGVHGREAGPMCPAKFSEYTGEKVGMAGFPREFPKLADMDTLGIPVRLYERL